MAYKTTTHKEFKGKGFVDPESLQYISTGKADNGQSYDLKEVFSKIAGNGDEVQFSVKVTETIDDVEDTDGE